MSEKLIGFLFFAVLGALGYHLALNLVYSRYLSASPLFGTYWLLPFAVAPGLLLLALAWWMGFYRRGQSRLPDLAVTLVILAIVTLTVPASYSCGSGCF